MEMKAKRQVIYAVLARVSTRDQQTGHSLDIQIDSGREYAQRSGATKVLVYREVESATGEERSKLESVLLDAENGKFEALIVQELTRLSRNPAVMLTAISRLQKAHVTLHDFQGPISLDTPEGEFKVFIESAVGRFTARQGVQKSINARTRILKSGGIAAGRPPWGRRWNKAKQSFELIPEKVELIKEVYKLIIHHGKSLNHAASALELPLSSLHKAISKASCVEVVQHLNGGEYKIRCPAILSPDDQRRLKARLTANRIVRRHTKGKYLLQSIVRCDACGATMTGQTFTRDGKSYSVYRHPPKSYKKETCVWHVPALKLEEDILEVCAEVISNAPLLRQAIEAALMDNNIGITELRDRLRQTELEMQRTNSRLDKTLDRLIAFDEGSESRKRLEVRAKNEELKLLQLRSEKDALSEQEILITLPNDTAEAIAAKLRSLYWRHGAGHVVMNFEQRREFVRTIVGRSARIASQGIYVRMLRPIKGSKKNISWAYKLIGDLAVAENRLRHYREINPEIIEIRTHGRDHVKTLAALANATVGVKLSSRRYVQSFKKYSSKEYTEHIR